MGEKEEKEAEKPDTKKKESPPRIVRPGTVRYRQVL